MHHKSAIQGINSGLGMVNVDLLHISNFAQTGNLGIHAVKAAGGLELAQPGICVIASHIVVGTVEGEPEDTACEAVIEKIKEAGYTKVVLRPLMVVAGSPSTVPMNTLS